MRSLAIFLLIACTPSFAGPEEGAVRPGKWTYTMKTVIPGVPFPPCRYDNWQRTGNITRYDMVCPDNKDVSGTFEYTASGTSITGKGVIKSGSTEIIQQWQGSRVGDC
jgi:hypothetical protein